MMWWVMGIVCGMMLWLWVSHAAVQKTSMTTRVVETSSKAVTTKKSQILTKYLCNAKSAVLEKHVQQPGYLSDGACSTTMQWWQVCASQDPNLAGTICMQPIIEPVYTKYLCNGKTNLLETHMDQPWYTTDGVCTTNMEPWHVCASLDTNLSGTSCNGWTVVPGFNCNTVTDVTFEECNALVDLYHNTAGWLWTKNLNWLAVPQVCSWYGVTCVNNHVTELRLEGNGLSGSVSASIGNLSWLKILFLPHNNLQWTLPSSVGNLTALEILVLENNKFTGNIPLSLGNLSYLHLFNLALNQFWGTIPSTLGNLTNLWQLQLHKNQLSGAIPDSLGNLWNLNYLSLQDNQLSGPMPVSLGNVSNLQFLIVRNNQLCGYIPSSYQNLWALFVGGFLVKNNRFMTTGYSAAMTTWFQSIGLSFGTQNSLNCN
jgi:hypothetical protein